MSATLKPAASPATTAAARTRGERPRTSPRRWLLVALLTALALMMVFPLYWMVVSALTQIGRAHV